MARKFVLVPQDMYHSLLCGPEDTAAHARAELDSALHDQSKSVAERNQLYAKRLYDFQELRKEAADKPLKVEVTNQLPIATQETNSNALAKTPGGERRAQDTPRAPRRMYTRKNRQREGASTPTDVNQLLELIAKKSEDFGVDDQGRIKNFNNRLVTNSNVRKCVLHILHPKPYAPEPPGTQELKTRLATRAETRRFVVRTGASADPVVQEGQGNRKRFKPILWSF